MKKCISFLLALCLMMSFAACKKAEPEQSAASSEPQGEWSDVGAYQPIETVSSKVVSSQKDTVASKSESNSSEDSDEDYQQSQKEESKVVSSEVVYDNSDDVIICFGDSITEGMHTKKENKYPTILSNNLNGQYKVINAGVSGENSYTISARANALEFTVTNPITFAAGQTEFESDWKIFSGINGEMMKLRYGTMGKELSIKDVIIDGKPYTLRYQASPDKVEENGKYFLGRKDATQAVKIPVGAKIRFDYSQIYKNRYCAVVLMGANDGGKVSIDELIARYKAIEATAEHFIALVPHKGTNYTAEFEEAFGNKCVNIRAYANGSLYQYYDLDKTMVDESDLKEGILPRTFSLNLEKNNVHLNDLGYKILGDLVYKKGVELGYWK